MELLRAERKLNEKPNYGAIFFKKTLELANAPPKAIAPSNQVLEYLESHATIRGPLDASDVIRDLCFDDQVEFFSRYNNCESLAMRYWEDMSIAVLRCVAVTMGATLTELDVSNSGITSRHLEVMLPHLQKLETVSDFMF
jgi:hypothetical protein